MAKAQYRIESVHPIVSPLLPSFKGSTIFLSNRSHAVVLAAKSNTDPYGHEIRVVHVPTGEVVYYKPGDYSK